MTFKQFAFVIAPLLYLALLFLLPYLLFNIKSELSDNQEASAILLISFTCPLPLCLLPADLWLRGFAYLLFVFLTTYIVDVIYYGVYRGFIDGVWL